MSKILVAGGVVWNRSKGIVVVNQNHNSWSLPKGHVEEGEDTLTAAIREIWEESGIPKEKLLFVTHLVDYERTRTKLHPEDADELRTITLYLFTTDQVELLPRDPENPEARWVPVNEVSALLTNPKDKIAFEEIKGAYLI